MIQHAGSHQPEYVSDSHVEKAQNEYLRLFFVLRLILFDYLDSPNKCNFSEGRSVAIVGIFLAKGKCTMAYTQLTEIERYQIFSLKEAG
ncbi:hypothetical protein KKJ25_03905, partial [Xenorhabdus bovienii]|uniref:hypothetical protein n=1 Tax=Xenorhabdus bovienii TaxID=40576 RepID=UPI00237C66DB